MYRIFYRKAGRKKKSAKSSEVLSTVYCVCMHVCICMYLQAHKDVPIDQNAMLSCLGQLIGWLNLYNKKLDAAMAGYEQSGDGLARWEDFIACLRTMRVHNT